MRVHIPTPLRSYTAGRTAVEAEGRTVAELFDDLERQFAGIRFRVIDEQNQIRRHIRVFVGKEVAGDPRHPLRGDQEVRIVMAISGG